MRNDRLARFTSLRLQSPLAATWTSEHVQWRCQDRPVGRSESRRLASSGRTVPLRGPSRCRSPPPDPPWLTGRRAFRMATPSAVTNPRPAWPTSKGHRTRPGLPFPRPNRSGSPRLRPQTSIPPCVALSINAGATGASCCMVLLALRLAASPTLPLAPPLPTHTFALPGASACLFQLARLASTRLHSGPSRSSILALHEAASTLRLGHAAAASAPRRF